MHDDDDRWGEAGTGWHQSDPRHVPTVKELNAIYRKPLRERLRDRFQTFVNCMYALLIIGGCILVWMLIAFGIAAIVKGDFG